MNLFTRNSPYYHLLKHLLFLLKHPVYLNTVISSLCKSSSCSLTFRFTNQCFLWSYDISDTFYMTHHAIALALVPWTISRKGYKLWNSSLRILPQLLVTSCLLLAHISPRALVPNTNIFALILVKIILHPQVKLLCLLHFNRCTSCKEIGRL